MYIPSAKGYFSGAGLMEIGIMQAGVNIIQSLDLDPDATNAMRLNTHYFNHSILNQDIKNITVLDQNKTDTARAQVMICFYIFLGMWH